MPIVRHQPRKNNQQGSGSTSRDVRQDQAREGGTQEGARPMMHSLMIAFVIVSLAYGARSSIRTLASQSDDPRAGLLPLIGVAIIVCGVWR
jgi:hypothetical protein